MEFCVNADGHTSVDALCPCYAWMIPPVQDEDTRPSVKWAAETFDLAFTAEVRLSITFGLLVTNDQSDGVSLVREINGERYAIIKRGLL